MTLCPRCSQPFDPAATGGICPRCALAAALTSAASAGPADEYEFIAELGRGGMGTVYLARQNSLDRLVALKVIATGPDPDGRAEIRLLREARAAAAISHPHVVAVHEVGQGASGAFIAMEYCEGGDLRERLRAGPLAPRAAAELVRKLADAVARAHAAGVLHRDLKPSNVLLTAAGEPKLSDFGLSGSVASVEATGIVAGSPAYLAPEALQPDHRPAPAQDIYGLGAVLYECVTGRAPFLGESAAAVLAQIPQAEPPAPHLLNRSIPRDLETIILKCLEKKPPARYATATGLRDDLDRLLAGHPIHARPVSAPGRLARWARRKPGLAAALAIILLGSTASALLLAERNQRLRNALARSESSEAATRRALSDSLLAQARAVRQSGRLGQRHEALRLVRESAALVGPSAQARTEALAALALDDWQWIWQHHTPGITANHLIGFDADLAHAAIPAADGAVDILRVADRQVIRHLKAPAPGRLVTTRFGAEPGWVLAEYADCTQAVWGPGDLQPRWAHRPANLKTCALAMAPDARGWWFVTTGNQVLWHDPATGRDTTYGAAGEQVYAVSPSPDGAFLAVLRDEHLELWCTSDRTLLWSNEDDYGVAPPAWTPDGRQLISDRAIGGAHELVILEREDGNIRQILRGGRLRSIGIALLPDTRRVLTLDYDSILHLWDLATGRELVLGKAGPNSFTLSRDGRRAAIAPDFQQLGVIELAPAEVAGTGWISSAGSNRLHNLATSGDGRWLIAQKQSGLFAWDAHTRRDAKLLDYPGGDPVTLAFLADGRVIYSSPTIGIRSLRLALRDGLAAAVDHQAIHPPDGTHLRGVDAGGRHWIVANGEQTRIELWPGGERARARQIGPALAARQYARLSADGGLAAIRVSRQSELGLYALPGAELRATLPVQPPAWPTFSPDGRWLGIAHDESYDVRDLAAPGQPVWSRKLSAARAIHTQMLFSPDSRRVALLVGGSTIELVEAGTGRTELTFTLPGGAEWEDWVWAPDGQTLYLVSGRNELHLLHPGAAAAALARLGLDWRG
ncbi:MAG TPA: WD40 repeat domain-containing serine/threonine protein kinase [Lacunisphaera sp.]|nr:WD40 repeat domain-containing serine/threonine protein kinase [Lacunisphaera sp.]